MERLPSLAQKLPFPCQNSENPTPMIQRFPLLRALLVLMLVAGCSDDPDLDRRSEQYDVVQEGSAAGVTGTLVPPNDQTVPPLTDTHVDTTTSFTIIETQMNPVAITGTGTGSLAEGLPGSAAAAPRPLASAPPRPAPTPPASREPSPEPESSHPESTAEPPTPQPEPPVTRTTPEPQPEPEPDDPAPPPTSTTGTSAPSQPEQTPPPEPPPPPPPPAESNDVEGGETANPPAETDRDGEVAEPLVE